jgi:hypothetical protein
MKSRELNRVLGARGRGGSSLSTTVTAPPSQMSCWLGYFLGQSGQRRENAATRAEMLGDIFLPPVEGGTEGAHGLIGQLVHEDFMRVRAVFFEEHDLR